MHRIISAGKSGKVIFSLAAFLYKQASCWYNSTRKKMCNYRHLCLEMDTHPNALVLVGTLPNRT